MPASTGPKARLWAAPVTTSGKKVATATPVAKWAMPFTNTAPCQSAASLARRENRGHLAEGGISPHHSFPPRSRGSVLGGRFVSLGAPIAVSVRHDRPQDGGRERGMGSPCPWATSLEPAPRTWGKNVPLRATGHHSEHRTGPEPEALLPPSVCHSSGRRRPLSRPLPHNRGSGNQPQAAAALPEPVGRGRAAAFRARPPAL